MDDVQGIIVSNNALGQGHFVVTLELARPIGPVLPGQFVMVRMPGAEIFLRRPFSICGIQDEVITIMYKVVGDGSRFLATMQSGDPLMVLGPLGNGFTVDRDRAAVVVAGGIGIAGVRLLAEGHRGPLKVMYGCTTASEAGLLAGLKGGNSLVATVDGSLGFHGTVVDLLATHPGRSRSSGAVAASRGPGFVRGRVIGRSR